MNNPLQLRKIELEKEIEKRYGLQTSWTNTNRQIMEAELKGINLGLKVLEDYSQQDKTQNISLHAGVTKDKTADTQENADELPMEVGLKSGSDKTLSPVYQKGYQDAIKEVLDKIDKCFECDGLNSCKFYPECEVCKAKEKLKKQISEVKQ